MSEYLEALKGAIFDMHGLRAKHLESVPVKEVFHGQTVWDGTVEVFALEGHPKAKKVYAWSHPDGEEGRYTRFFAVLEIPPVTSPETAVKAAIVAGGQ